MVRLKVYDGQEKAGEVELGSDPVSIGRDAGNALVLPDVSVSRRHAQIEPSGNFFLIRDHGSTNGTFVNEMLVRVQVLSPGDTVRIGKFLLRVESKRAREHDSTNVRVEPLRFPASTAARGEETGAPARGESAVRFESDASLAQAGVSRLLRLCEVQKELAHLDATQDLIEHSLDLTVSELHADRGSVLLCETAGASGGEGGGRKFIPAAVRASQAGSGGREVVIPEALLLQAAASKKALRADVPGSPGRQCLAAPLCDKNRVLGVVYIDRSPAQPPFSPEDLQFLAAMANATAVSLSNALLLAEVAAERDKMQAVFTSLTDGLMVTDRDFTILEANSAATVLLDLQGKNPLGAKLADLFSGFKLSPTMEVLRASSLQTGAVFQLAGRERAGSPAALTGERDIALAGKMLPFPKGAAEPKGVLVVLRDRTEVQRVEALKTQFIGNVAHKLRSPLTVIEGNLPLLREDTGETGQIIDDIARNSATLCRLVNQFIEFAELELRTTSQQSAPERTALKPLVREAVRAVENEALRKGILVVERLKEPGPLVEARAERLVRAFRHVLENAVKFAGQGGQVVVEAADLGDCVRLDFSDDGPGIPREQIESVFLVGHQVDRERTGEVPGAGLGLAVARHIAQEHGGEIQITSPYRFADHGTQVSILLPAAVRAGAKELEPMGAACAGGA